MRLYTARNEVAGLILKYPLDAAEQDKWRASTVGQWQEDAASEPDDDARAAEHSE